MTDPVIIVGTHRSGTSLVTRLLDDAGLFIGRQIEGNHEAVFFLRLNQWALRCAGATWDDPSAVRYLLGHAEGRAVVTDYFQRSFQGRKARAFFGAGRRRTESGPWGWKDPRNCATLPMWRDVFPDAKVVVVDRHGVDVAQSLRRRFEKTWPVRKARYEKYAPTYAWRDSKHPVTTGFRVSALDGAFAAWRSYQALVDEHTEGLGDRLLRFRYEDLLEAPEATLPPMFEFAGLDVDGHDVEAIASRIDASRAFAYRRDEGLTAFAKTQKEALAAYGYRP